MKNKSSNVAVAATAFATILLSLACTPGTNNGNLDQTSGQNTSQANTGVTARAASDACDAPDSQKAGKVKDKIIEKMSQRLKNQLEVDPTVPKQFKFQVRKSSEGDYLEAYFQGEISGDDHLKELSDILNDFQKKGCLLKVYFVADGPVAVTLPEREIQFAWSACEHPLTACPNGVCDNPCPWESPPITNGNLNSNTNSNNTNRVNTSN